MEMTPADPGSTAVRCPVPLCGTENDFAATACAGCRTPLLGYARLRAYPAQLFNQGLAAARDRRLPAARDCFAAVVHWCPGDIGARNALALACLQLGDRDEARRQWEEVLTRRPADPQATDALSLLRTASG
jgi:Flp pilus assembly protein TadD